MMVRYTDTKIAKRVEYDRNAVIGSSFSSHEVADRVALPNSFSLSN